MKRFLVRILIGGVPLLAILLFSLYYHLYVRPELTGDLGQLGKIRFGTEYNTRITRPLLPDLQVHPLAAGTPVGRIVTIGDSFSQQEQHGYQNFLAHRSGEPVTNLRLQEWAIPEQAAADLLATGFFDTLPQVRWVIVESVERGAADRFLDLQLDSPTRQSPLVQEDSETPAAPRGARLSRTVRQSKDWMLYSCGLARNPVHNAPLARPLFTLPGRESTLYFYWEDLNRLAVSDDELHLMRESLRMLHDRFYARGIGLLYLIAPDKYELYQPFIVGNPYPAQRSGDQLRRLDSLAFFIWPLPQLRAQLESGEQDLYWANDTHWSQKGAGIVADLLYEKMQRLAADSLPAAERIGDNGQASGLPGRVDSLSN